MMVQVKLANEMNCAGCIFRERERERVEEKVACDDCVRKKMAGGGVFGI